MNKIKRVEWIDICKAFTVYLMVLAHVGVTKNIDIFIHSFHMPLFFVLSGFCFNEVKYNKLVVLIKSRFKTLIIPYIIFGTGLFMFWNICLMILNRKDEMQPLTSLLASMFWINTRAKPFGVVQWFLTALFVAEIIFWVLLHIGKNEVKKVACLLAVVAVLAGIYPEVSDFRLPWAIDSALMGTVFFGAGWVLKKLDVEKICYLITRNKFKCVVLSMGVAMIVVPLVFINGDVNIRSARYQNVALLLINAIIMTGIIIVCSVVVSDKKRKGKIYESVVFAGKHTLVVLLLNSTLIRIWEVVIGDKLAIRLGDGIYWVNVFVALAVLIIAVIMSVIIEKYVPFFVGKKL